MHGCSYAVLVYGFNMGYREHIIYHDYLYEVFPDISQYAADIVRNYLGEAIYGIPCALDIKTGQALIDDSNKQKVYNLYDKYISYLKQKLTKKQFNIKIKEIDLGFRLAVSGDYDTCHEYIIPDLEWKSHSDEEDI